VYLLTQNVHSTPITQQAEKLSFARAERESDVPVNFSWKLTKDKTVKYPSLELTRWYQAVPYLRLKSQPRRHVAMQSYLSKNHDHSGNRKGKKEHCRTGDVSMTTINLWINMDACAKPWPIFMRIKWSKAWTWSCVKWACIDQSTSLPHV
jgi:hypothetical protein